MRTIALLMALLCLLLSGAQAAPDPALVKGVAIPFEYYKQHIFITLKDDKLGEMRMLVDTGADRTIVDVQTAARGDVHGSFWKRKTVANGLGEKKFVQKYQTAALSLRAGESIIFAPTALAMDLEGTGTQLGRPLDGILGWDFFDSHCITLNYKTQVLTVQDRDSCQFPKTPFVMVRGTWSDHGLWLRVLLRFSNGQLVRAVLRADTGSDVPALLNPKYRAAAGGTAYAIQRGMGWGVSGVYGLETVPILDMDVEGQVHWKGPDAAVTIGSEKSFARLRDWDGLMGNSFLEQLTWKFDAASRRLYVTDEKEDSAKKEDGASH